jgi:hypothetical protein
VFNHPWLRFLCGRRTTGSTLPAQIKVLVVYLCMGLVSLILGTIAVRAVVAFATWLVTGRALWLLPNALSDVRPLLTTRRTVTA